MSIKNKQRGTGITKHPAVEVNPEDGREFEITKNLMQHVGTTLARTLERIEREAAAILAAAGLPTTFGPYQRRAGGGWEPWDGQRVAGHYATGARGAADADGFDHDSPEGYAARAVDRIANFRRKRDAGDEDGASLEIFNLGVMVKEAQMKGRWESDTMRGLKSPAAGKVGHEMVHGTEEEKRARWRAYVADFESLRAQGKSISAAERIVAKRHKCSTKTVQRAVKRLV